MGWLNWCRLGVLYRTERGPGPRRGSLAGVVDAPDARGNVGGLKSG